MYIVYYGKEDENVLHDSLLGNEYILPEAKLTLELNTAGIFEFTIRQSHPLYNVIQELSERVYVFDNKKLLFSGFITNITKDFQNAKVCTCEGELSNLSRAFTYPYQNPNCSQNELLRRFIIIYNRQVGDYDDKVAIDESLCRINVPNNNNGNPGNSDYSNVWAEIRENIIEKYGGYIYWRLANPRQSNEKNYIEYLSDLNTNSNQVIEFGENLISLQNSVDLTELVTAVYPRGANDIGIGADGKGVIVNESLASKYGYRWAVMTWDEITNANTLYTVANAWLKEQTGIKTIELTAADLSFINSGVDRFELGKKIRAISKMHGLDSYFLCSKLEIDLNSLANTVVTLGQTRNMLSDRIISNI